MAVLYKTHKENSWFRWSCVEIQAGTWVMKSSTLTARFCLYGMVNKKRYKRCIARPSDQEKYSCPRLSVKEGSQVLFGFQVVSGYPKQRTWKGYPVQKINQTSSVGHPNLVLPRICDCFQTTSEYTLLFSVFPILSGFFEMNLHFQLTFWISQGKKREKY